MQDKNRVGMRDMQKTAAIDKWVSFLITSLALLSLGTGCVNPVKETYQKGVEGGMKAIDQSKEVQNLVDRQNQQLQQQQKQMEGVGQN